MPFHVNISTFEIKFSVYEITDEVLSGIHEELSPTSIIDVFNDGVFTETGSLNTLYEKYKDQPEVKFRCWKSYKNMLKGKSLDEFL